MGKQYFLQLLHKYLKGESTLEEDDLIISYYNLFEYGADGLDLLSEQKKEEIKLIIERKTGKNLNSK